MSTKNSSAKYTEEFKKTIVSLHQNGKTYSQIQKEYGPRFYALFMIFQSQLLSRLYWGFSKKS